MHKVFFIVSPLFLCSVFAVSSLFLNLKFLLYSSWAICTGASTSDSGSPIFLTNDACWCLIILGYILMDFNIVSLCFPVYFYYAWLCILDSWSYCIPKFELCSIHGFWLCCICKSLIVLHFCVCMCYDLVFSLQMDSSFWPRCKKKVWWVLSYFYSSSSSIVGIRNEGKIYGIPKVVLWFTAPAWRTISWGIWRNGVHLHLGNLWL